MISGIPSRPLLLLLALAAAAVPAADDPATHVAAFLAELAPPPAGAIPFVERRMSALLVAPIEVRGELTISPDGVIDKYVTLPARERVQITARTVTVERKGKSRTMNVAGDARWRAFHAGITGLMNRDPAALERLFTVSLVEQPEGWMLELRPRDGGGRNRVTLITASGIGAQLLRLRLEQGPGEWQEMTFPQAGS